MPKLGESGAVVRRPFARRREYRGETMVGLTRVEGLRSDSMVITETAEAGSLECPFAPLGEVGKIGGVPPGERLRISNFSRRVALAIAARDPHDTAIHYVPDGNIDR